MKNFPKIAIICICLLFIAICTSACGSSKTTPPQTFPYWLLTQNNNQQEENNEEEPVITTEINLTLTDSKDAEKIATADIYYSGNTTKKSSADDKEILKATPNADDKTKFTVTVNGEVTNVKIKAILTYDNKGNLLDYFSSYNGVEATNGTYDIDFGNSKDNEEGFGGGNGEDEPYIISAPRHFVNINKQDDQGNYLYLDKYFQQTEDIDFSHLTGLKIVSADDDKDITVETTNEKAPFYNDGHGITPIGVLGDLDTTADAYKNSFKGIYDGNNKTIDGIMFVNPDTQYISLFPGFAGDYLKNINIGSNSIIYINGISDKNHLCIGSFLTYSQNDKNTITVENCVNNCKIILKNSKNIETLCLAGLTSMNDNLVKSANCINNGNISVIGNEIKYINVAGCFIINNASNNIVNNCTNNGIIKIANNKTDGNSSKINVSGLYLDNPYIDYSSGSDPIVIPVDPNNPLNPIIIPVDDPNNPLNPIIIPVDDSNPPFSFPADPIHILFP